MRSKGVISLGHRSMHWWHCVQFHITSDPINLSSWSRWAVRAILLGLRSRFLAAGHPLEHFPHCVHCSATAKYFFSRFDNRAKAINSSCQPPPVFQLSNTHVLSQEKVWRTLDPCLQVSCSNMAFRSRKSQLHGSFHIIEGLQVRFSYQSWKLWLFR